MAKWGEGDPRWIVEERADGTNANNWHWTEKNATGWSQKKITELLTNLKVEGDVGHATISEVSSITGDAIANCRKGKLIFFYELVIELKWKGETSNGTKVNGKCKIPNLSEEQDIEDDVEVQVQLISDDTPERRKVKELVRKKGADLIRKQLVKWNKELKEEYSLDLVKPTDKRVAQIEGNPASASAPASAVGTKIDPLSSSANKAKSEPKKESKSDDKDGQKYESITLQDEFRCAPDALFRAIVTEDQVKAYTQSDCKIDAKVGGEFSLFGGNVVGVFQELVPHEKIKQAWRFKHWPDGHFSTVTMTIESSSGVTKLKLAQSGIPSKDVETTKNGWRSHQWERMKAIMGFGASLNFGGF
jgi:activator of HSP90 ATPase